MKYTKELYRINCIVCVTSGDAFIFEHLFFIYPALLAAKPPILGSFTVHTIRIFSFLSEFCHIKTSINPPEWDSSKPKMLVSTY
mmetsp:Transcript_37879/g.42424  ORF Transcript_37879/g.42424 Transcript_37879/m.42424 type:complete len:84 (+) Transcript_37879:573-824(+)